MQMVGRRRWGCPVYGSQYSRALACRVTFSLAAASIDLKRPDETPVY
jgi:hypothetical protein